MPSMYAIILPLQSVHLPNLHIRNDLSELLEHTSLTTAPDLSTEMGLLSLTQEHLLGLDLTAGGTLAALNDTPMSSDSDMLSFSVSETEEALLLQSFVEATGTDSSFQTGENGILLSEIEVQALFNAFVNSYSAGGAPSTSHGPRTPTPALGDYTSKSLRVIVKEQAMLLIGAQKSQRKTRLRTLKGWILPHTPRPHALPRFCSQTGRLYLEINWKKGSGDELNTEFINALVLAVQATEAPATVGVAKTAIRKVAGKYFKTMRINYFAQRSNKENIEQQFNPKIVNGVAASNVST
ncbi:hypothetical protein HWV62_6003 [Athelia sp. TMB]|nr:hypothetical protein HWV62_6003 [Athelia sp. TMB]